MNLAFYTGKQCHLCDLAQQLLEQDQHYSELQIEKFDVSQDHNLYHLYGARIPVIKRIDTEAELGWPFTAQSLREFLG